MKNVTKTYKIAELERLSKNRPYWAGKDENGNEVFMLFYRFLVGKIGVVCASGNMATSSIAYLHGFRSCVRCSYHGSWIEAGPDDMFPSPEQYAEQEGTGDVIVVNQLVNDDETPADSSVHDIGEANDRVDR